MELKEVDASTEDAFLRCLHLEAPAEPETLALRRRWYDRFKDRGLRANNDGNDVTLDRAVGDPAGGTLDLDVGVGLGEAEVIVCDTGGVPCP